MKKKFKVLGMMCTACSTHVENAVRGISGVRSAEVSLLLSSMTVEYDETILTEGDIIEAVTRVGYRAELYRDGEKITLTEEKASLKPLLFSIPLSLLLMYLEMGHHMLPLPSFLHPANAPVLWLGLQLVLALAICFLK